MAMAFEGARRWMAAFVSACTHKGAYSLHFHTTARMAANPSESRHLLRFGPRRSREGIQKLDPVWKFTARAEQKNIVEKWCEKVVKDGNRSVLNRLLRNRRARV
jgi:hypothetical protein